MNYQAGQFRLFRNPVFICLLLILATFAIYFPVRNYDFVSLDDPFYFFSNPHVLTGLRWSNFEWALANAQSGDWHPLTWVSLMLNVSLFGAGPASPHLTNVLLHAINSILVFRVFLRMTGATWRSAGLAMLFAIHPLHVESVAWITERKDVLSGFFGLLTLYCYARYAELAERNDHPPQAPGNPQSEEIHDAQRRRSRRAFYGFALFFFICGIMSKAMLVTLPCVLLLLDVWPLQRVALERNGNGPTLKRLLVEKIPFFLPAAASSVIVYFTGKEWGSMAMLVNDSLSKRLANAFVSYSRYLAKIFCPINLAIPYPNPGRWPVFLVIASAGLFVILCAIAVAARKKAPYVFTGWFWFVGMLVPVIGLVQAGVQSMADRFAYLPLIGVLMAVIWAAAELCLKSRVPEWAIVLCASMLFLAGAVRAANQVTVWKNDGTLFGHAVAVTKNNYVASVNLASWYSHHGRVEDALKLYDDAMQMSSNDPAAISYSADSRFQTTLSSFYGALRADELYNIGNGFAKQGNWDEAIRDYRRALQIAPGQQDIMNNLGLALAKEKRYADAVTNFLAVVQLTPTSANARNNLASVLFAQGQYGQAAQQFRAALQLSPQDPRICVNLAGTCLRLAETNEAVKYYRQALQLQPDNPQARFQLQRLGIPAAN